MWVLNRATNSLYLLHHDVESISSSLESGWTLPYDLLYAKGTWHIRDSVTSSRNASLRLLGESRRKRDVGFFQALPIQPLSTPWLWAKPCYKDASIPDERDLSLMRTVRTRGITILLWLHHFSASFDLSCMKSLTDFDAFSGHNDTVVTHW